jgi:hypothetical protein
LPSLGSVTNVVEAAPTRRRIEQGNKHCVHLLDRWGGWW